MKNNDKIVNQYKGIILAIFWLGISVSFILAMLTYNAADVCLNVSNENPIQNWLGQYGAFVADILLQSFGLSSGFMSIIIFIWSLYAVFGYKIRLWIRVPVLLIGGSAFAVVLGAFTKYNFFLQMLPGGYVGYSLFSILSEKFYQPAVICIAIFIWLFTSYISLPSFNVDGIKRVYLILMEKIKKILHQIYAIITLQSIRSIYKNIDSTKFVAKEILRLDKTSNSIKSKKNQSVVHARVDFKDIVGSSYIPPKTSLLALSVMKQDNSGITVSQQTTSLINVLNEFGVKGNIVNCYKGPVVTLFELRPVAGTKALRVIGLSNDVARTMGAVSVRISTIPGRDVIGIEMPNAVRQGVDLRSLLESQAYMASQMTIPIILGRDIMGGSVVVDLTKMPHLLIAGTTGSGKSVGMGAMIMSMLYKLSPQQCKFIMIDPKMLEFSVYDGIPHLLSPVITDPKRAVISLKWLVSEMERRYKMMSNMGIRNIMSYNERLSMTSRASKNIDNDDQENKHMPYIVVIIDEMADLMLVAGKEIEALIQRLAQMARAAGIHLIMATQRPSVDVITGVIKANFPTRISYNVTSKIDSRTILGEQGAEQLLGSGDMLYMAPGGKIHRVHGPFVSDDEVRDVVEHLKDNYDPEYIEIDNFVPIDDYSIAPSNTSTTSDDDYYDQALKIVMTEKKASISYIQRKLRIGYNKAANIVEKMESVGILSQPDNSGKRTIL